MIPRRDAIIVEKLGPAFPLPFKLRKTGSVDSQQNCYQQMSDVKTKIRALRSFVIRFDFESYVRFEIRFVVTVRFEIFESSTLSIVIRKATIGGG